MELPREYMIFKSRVLNFTLSSPDFESKKSIKLHARPVYGVLCGFFFSKQNTSVYERIIDGLEIFSGRNYCFHNLCKKETSGLLRIIKCIVLPA